MTHEHLSFDGLDGLQSDADDDDDGSTADGQGAGAGDQVTADDGQQSNHAQVDGTEDDDLVDDLLDLVDKGLATDSMTVTIGYDRGNVDTGNYSGEIKVDRYGRAVPKSAHGTADFGSHTSSTRKIVEGVVSLFDRIIDKNLMVRRITMSANNVVDEAYMQYDLFTDPSELLREKKMQKAMLSIQKKFGKIAILKGTNLEEGATTIDRNKQIGGHRA